MSELSYWVYFDLGILHLIMLKELVILLQQSVFLLLCTPVEMVMSLWVV